MIEPSQNITSTTIFEYKVYWTSGLHSSYFLLIIYHFITSLWQRIFDWKYAQIIF